MLNIVTQNPFVSAAVYYFSDPPARGIRRPARDGIFDSGSKDTAKNGFFLNENKRLDIQIDEAETIRENGLKP